MTCRCGRENDARRCYCGACGRRIGKACARCQFVNSTDDSFCGGCGDALEAVAVVTTAFAEKTVPITKLAAVKAAPASPDKMSAAEPASLLGKSAASAQAPLPAHVTQDDLDRLFGGTS